MTRKKTTLYCTERRWFFGALALLMMMFGAYVYFVSASIVHVIARKEVDRNIAQLQSRIGEMEAAYIAADHAITEAAIGEYGFVANGASDKVFVQKASDNLVLVVHDEG